MQPMGDGSYDWIANNQDDLDVRVHRVNAVYDFVFFEVVSRFRHGSLIRTGQRHLRSIPFQRSIVILIEVITFTWRRRNIRMYVQETYQRRGSALHYSDDDALWKTALERILLGEHPVRSRMFHCPFLHGFLAKD